MRVSPTCTVKSKPPVLSWWPQLVFVWVVLYHHWWCLADSVLFYHLKIRHEERAEACIGQWGQRCLKKAAKTFCSFNCWILCCTVLYFDVQIFVSILSSFHELTRPTTLCLFLGGLNLMDSLVRLEAPTHTSDSCTVWHVVIKAIQKNSTVFDSPCETYSTFGCSTVIVRVRCMRRLPAMTKYFRLLTMTTRRGLLKSLSAPQLPSTASFDWGSASVPAVSERKRAKAL